MAWTAPITFIPRTALTAAQLNTYVRDNLMESLPAKATTAGSHFVVTGKNQIAERYSQGTFLATVDTTDSTEYTDLATYGPEVTVETGEAAYVLLYCQLSNNAGNAAWMNYDISGDSTSDSQDNRGFMFQSTTPQAGGIIILHEHLTAGTNTFTAKYRVTTSGVGKFQNRRLAVIPL